MNALRIIPATNLIRRARGLLCRRPLEVDQALLLCPCRAVHTFFMRYAIDIVLLDREGQVIKLAEALRPWRIVYARRAYAALELRSRQARRHGLHLGSRHRFPPHL